MNAFRDDNTEGFTAAQLVVMNDEYHHDLALALEGLPDGADGADDWLIANIKQNVAEVVLRRRGAA